MSDHDSESTPRLLEVRPEPHPESHHRLWLRYEDGAEGTVDLSEEIRAGGVFAVLAEHAVFATAELGEFDQVQWEGGIDMCSHALYLRLTKMAPRELFPNLTRQPADA